MVVQVNVIDERTSNNQSLTHGDFVTCMNCGELMLVDIGCERCPICEEQDLTFTDSEMEEVDEEYFTDNPDFLLVRKA